MLRSRIIPCLLIHNKGLVKTVKFKDPKYVGDPINAVKIFNEKEVDELIVVDIEASKKGVEPNYKLIEQFASECFMPLSYGGGVNSLSQAKKIFSLGVEKIAIQSACYKNSTFVKDLSDYFGSQSIIVSIDIKRNWLGKYGIFSKTINKLKIKNWKEFLIEVARQGAGEILINSVNKDGTLTGPDLNLIKSLNGLIDIPIIYSGGVSNLDDMKNVIDNGASAVAAGAFFVFKGPRKAVLISYPNYEDLEKIF